MDLRVERDALADAVTWTARSLPARPPMQVLLGLLLDAGSDDAGSRSPGSTTRSARGCGSTSRPDEPGRVLVPGGCCRRSSARCPPSRSTCGSRAPACADLRRGPLHLPTLPVEDYPELPAMPATAGTLGSDVFAAAVAQVALAAGRRRHAPGPDRRPLRDRGRDADLAARPLPPGRADLPWRPVDAGVSTTALVPAPHAVRDRSALTPRPRSRSPCRPAAGTRDDRLRGRRPPDDVPAAGGRVPQVPVPAARARAPPWPRSPTGPFAETVKRVALVGARNAPVRLGFSADGWSSRPAAPTTRRPPSTWSAPGPVRRPRPGSRSRSRSTRSTCSTAWGPWTATPRPVVHRAHRPAVLTGKRDDSGAPAGPRPSTATC
jgi:DNA polymerase-3 subunit beta